MLSDKGDDKGLISDEYPDTTLDATLNYISKVLLEDDLEEKEASLHEESAVTAIEKPFYDILRKSYPNTMNISETLKTPQGCQSSTIQNFTHLPGSGNLIAVLACKFDKELNKGMKLIPSIGERSVNFRESNLFGASSSTCENEEDEDEVLITSGSGGKMKLNVDNLDQLEGRIRKVGMLSSEETARRSTLLDEVLLQHDNYMKIVSKLKELNLREANNSAETDQGEVENLKRLLIRCSEAVYDNNRQSAEQLIEQIRNRSSLDGDGMQRMAFLYADALEARLTGTGGEAWRRLCGRRTPTSEFAKLAQLYITAAPFPRIHICCSNRTILKAAERASVLHIVDFGIAFGFQWPSLIQAMSNQNANVTKIRITGIDFPRPGFRPTELVDETGRRLEDYAKSFNVPFEYRGITSKNWEAISMDELNIKNDELLIVTCMYRLKEIRDESVSLDSPRDRVLKLIHKMRPHLFIEGIMSIPSYSPFFSHGSGKACQSIQKRLNYLTL